VISEEIGDKKKKKKGGGGAADGGGETRVGITCKKIFDIVVW
jgi:hypothetical protein